MPHDREKSLTFSLETVLIDFEDEELAARLFPRLYVSPKSGDLKKFTCAHCGADVFCFLGDESVVYELIEKPINNQSSDFERRVHRCVQPDLFDEPVPF